MSWGALLAAAEAIRDAAAATEARLAGLRVVGVGWATVDSDRAIGELNASLPVPGPGPGEWVAQERDALLGASVRRREPSPDAGVALLVLEPDTEGRLAAFLARFSEGVGAVYLSASGGDADRVVPVSPRWGPYAIVRGRSG
jgi:hypothetical protein